MPTSKNSATKSSRSFLGLDPAVAIGLTAALVFFLGSGLIAYSNVQSLEESNRRIVQTHVAIVALDELLSRVQDAETGQRGFLLTGTESYLGPYQSSLAAIAPKLDDIGRLTAPNPGQDERLSVLRLHVDAKLSELRETIDLRRMDELDEALAIVDCGWFIAFETSISEAPDSPAPISVMRLPIAS